MEPPPQPVVQRPARWQGPTPMRYAIRRVAPLAAFRFGFVWGALVGLAPGLLLGVTVAMLVHWAHGLLASWASVRFPLGVTINPLAITHTRGLLTMLATLDHPFSLTLLGAAIVMVVVGVSGGLSAGSLALLYNFGARFGGQLELDLEAVKPLPPRR